MTKNIILDIDYNTAINALKAWLYDKRVFHEIKITRGAGIDLVVFLANGEALINIRLHSTQGIDSTQLTWNNDDYFSEDVAYIIIKELNKHSRPTSSLLTLEDLKND